MMRDQKLHCTKHKTRGKNSRSSSKAHFWITTVYNWSVYVKSFWKTANKLAQRTNGVQTVKVSLLTWSRSMRKKNSFRRHWKSQEWKLWQTQISRSKTLHVENNTWTFASGDWSHTIHSFYTPLALRGRWEQLSFSIIDTEIIRETEVTHRLQPLRDPSRQHDYLLPRRMSKDLTRYSPRLSLPTKISRQEPFGTRLPCSAFRRSGGSKEFGVGIHLRSFLVGGPAWVPGWGAHRACGGRGASSHRPTAGKAEHSHCFCCSWKPSLQRLCLSFSNAKGIVRTT